MQAPCIEWPGYKGGSSGYGCLRISGKTKYAHRLIYELFVGAIPEGMNVCHHCDNPACVRLDHLFLGTQMDNMRDAAAKGRLANRVIGPRAPRKPRTSPPIMATAEQVMAIRQSTDTSFVLAARHGLNASTVRSIRIGRTWKHLPMRAA